MFVLIVFGWINTQKFKSGYFCLSPCDWRTVTGRAETETEISTLHHRLRDRGRCVWFSSDDDSTPNKWNDFRRLRTLEATAAHPTVISGIISKAKLNKVKSLTSSSSSSSPLHKLNRNYNLILTHQQLINRNQKPRNFTLKAKPIIISSS